MSPTNSCGPHHPVSPDAPVPPTSSPPDRRGAAVALAALAAGQRVPNTLKELIADAGGTRSASRLLGKSQRQMQRWARGEVHEVPTGSAAAGSGPAARLIDAHTMGAKHSPW